MAVVRRAQELVGAGWSYTEARDILVREGVSVDARSIARWTDQRAADASARSDEATTARRAAVNGSTGVGTGRERPEYKLARMRALREQAGLKDAQIARLMTFDYGEPMTREMVQLALENGRYPRSLTHPDGPEYVTVRRAT